VNSHVGLKEGRMADDAEQQTDLAAGEADRAELRQAIDRLMAGPPRAWPSIIVVGDETVSAIYAPGGDG
jgi:hypothetical protein